LQTNKALWQRIIAFFKQKLKKIWLIHGYSLNLQRINTRNNSKNILNLKQNIMKKSLIFGAALMLVGAFAFQSCANESKPGVPTEAAIDNGTELADVIVSHAKDGVLALPKSVVELNVSADIDLSQVEIQNESPLILNVAGGVKITLGKNLNNVSINGNAEAPATIEATETVGICGTEDSPIGIANAKFVIADNLALENAVIDATAIADPLIALSAEGGKVKNQDVYTDADGQDWALVSFIIENSIIQLDNKDKNFIAFDATANNKGAIKNISITNSTIYNINETSSAYFIRFANTSNAAKAFGTNNGTSTYDWVFTNNTLINTFKGKNFGNNTVNNAKTNITMTGNIYVDVNNISKFAQGNCTKVIENNFGFGQGQEASMSTKLEAAPFTVPTNALDLTAENGGLNLTPSGDAAKAGDPRWIAE